MGILGLFYFSYFGKKFHTENRQVGLDGYELIYLQY